MTLDGRIASLPPEGYEVSESSELAQPTDKGRRDWPLLVGLATTGVALLGLLPAYFIFWHRSDVVFDKRAVEIPLSGPLRKTIEDALSSAGPIFDSIPAKKSVAAAADGTSQLPSKRLPDRLLYVNIRNVGKIPSSLIKVQILVPGLIADKDVTGAGSVLGDITGQKSIENGVYFECPNLANDAAAELKVAIWYQQTSDYVPSVQVMETTEGPSREVGSVDTAGFYLIDHWWVPYFLALPFGVAFAWILYWFLSKSLLKAKHDSD
jgi:hypothetical protein